MCERGVASQKKQVLVVGRRNGPILDNQGLAPATQRDREMHRQTAEMWQVDLIGGPSLTLQAPSLPLVGVESLSCLLLVVCMSSACSAAVIFGAKRVYLDYTTYLCAWHVCVLHVYSIQPLISGFPGEPKSGTIKFHINQLPSGCQQLSTPNSN